MAHRVDESPQDVHAEHETAVALQVAWFAALARACRSDDGDALRRDPDIRTAQVNLIHALLLACADGVPLEGLRARFIEPVGRESRVSGEATALLSETVRLVERHLACRA
jgi:hypothetical protein